MTETRFDPADLRRSVRAHKDLAVAPLPFFPEMPVSVQDLLFSSKACRMVVVRKNLTVTKGENRLFDDVRHFFYISNDRKMTRRTSSASSRAGSTR